MISCRETTRLLSEGADRDLALGERVALRLHLAICKGCRNVSDQFSFLREAVKNLSADADADASA